MTPSKTKPPLPSSASIILPVPSQPTTYTQWKTTLVHVKSLYLKSQYKQCAARCTELVLEAKTPIEPLHRTFLHFYAAVCNEAIARGMHSSSGAKIALLEETKRGYEAAAAALPIVVETIELDQDVGSLSESSTVTPGGESRPLTPRPIYGEQLLEFSPPSYTGSDDDKSLEVSPLRIHKAYAFPPNPATTTTHPTKPPRQARAAIVPPNSTPSPNPSPYTSHLHAFTAMLSAHITTTTALIHSTQALQAQRCTIRRLASYGLDEEAKAMDRKERIQRGRARGWRRERFRPERYWEVCERAVGEL